MEWRTKNAEVPYIKGHMGGNTIALLPGTEISEEALLEKAALALQDTHLCCHESGIIYPSSDKAKFRVRIVGRASKKFISACGGLTQVLGAAIGSGEFLANFGFGPSGPLTLTLETDGGLVSLEIQLDQNTLTTKTDMTSFLNELRQDGIEPIELDRIKAVRAGKFLVLCADELMSLFNPSEIQELSPQVRDVLSKLQGIFLDKYPKAGLDFALYDFHPERPGNFGRVVFPHCLPAGLIEPACGTGTVAICAVLELLGLSNTAGSSGELSVKFESGGGPYLGGPDVTTAFMHINGGKIEKIWFSHSKVEITSKGKVMLG